MAYPRRLLTEGESVEREFRQHWRLLVVPLAWTILGGAAIIVTWVTDPDERVLDWVVTAVAGLVILRYGLYRFIQWWFTLYVLTNERLIKRSGVLARRGLEIPLENINDIRFTQNVLERILRSGDLLIESAGEQGQSEFGNIPDPEKFQSEIYRVREDRTMTYQSGRPDPTDQLERLARLHTEGVISDEEYAEKRQKLLGML